MPAITATILTDENILMKNIPKKPSNTPGTIADSELLNSRLKQEHTLLVDVLESMSDAFVSIDKNWCYTYMNKKAGLIFNRDPKEIIGKHIWTEFPEGIGQTFQKNYEKVMNEKVVITMEEYYPPYDKWFENRIFPTENGITIFFQDITDRKKTNMALKESEERFRILLEQAVDGIFHGDPVGNFIGVNTKGVEMTGYTREELLTMNMGQLFTEEEKKRTPLRYDLLKEGKTITNERYLTRKDDSIVAIEMHTKMMPDGTYQSIFRDITERKKTIALIKESELHYRTIFENTGTATVIIEEDTIISLANTKFEELSGYTKQEIENKKSWMDFVVREDLLIMAERHKSRRKDAELAVRSYEFRFIDKSGTIKHILLTIDMVPGTTKSVASLLDITERKTAEIELRESEKRYRHLFEHNPAPMLIYERVSLQLLAVNEAFLKHYGYSFDQVESMRLPDLYPEEQKIPIVELANRIVGHAHAGEWCHVKANGDVIDILAISHDISFEHRNCRIAVINDITERKKAEQALRESEEKYRKVIESATDSIAILKDGITQYVNPRLLNFSGYSEEEVIGKPFIDHVAPDQKNVVMQNYQKRISGEKAPIGYELNVILKGNKTVTVEVTASIFNYMGAPAELVFLHDITERKQIENRILQINEELEEKVQLRTRQLEEANKELETFSYSVSHDLRAPLRAISGFTKILTEDYSKIIGDEGQRICNVIQDETTRMEHLIDDLLAFSRLNKSSMNSALTDMNELVSEIFEETKKQYSDKKVTFELNHLLPAMADRNLMRQVWVNLFSNAFKFSSKKEHIEIKVGCTKKQDEIIYFIEDKGAGFNPKYNNKLFGVFQRLHSLKDFQGTGVGLAIVHHIILRHGGRIWAEGKMNEGATFYFSLPSKN